jgi:hypothetical protein
VLVFLDHYLQFFQVTILVTVEHLFYCNNKGLLNRIRYSWTNPNHCLASEFDLESEVLEILHRLPFKLSLDHVKGHQDKANPPVQDLPWEAQMNCHAEEYATDYLGDWSEPSKSFPLFLPQMLPLVAPAPLSLGMSLCTFAWLLAVHTLKSTSSTSMVGPTGYSNRLTGITKQKPSAPWYIHRSSSPSNGLMIYSRPVATWQVWADLSQIFVPLALKRSKPLHTFADAPAAKHGEMHILIRYGNFWRSYMILNQT